MFSRRQLAGTALAAAAVPASALIGSRSLAQAPADESTIDRIRRTKVLRAAALPGELPYFLKNLATGEWSGMCIDMCKDIAKDLDVKIEWLESTYGNSVLDLQSNKIDLAFALNPTPQRALVIDFTHPVYMHGFGMVGRQGFTAKTWSDLNKPEVRVVCDLGSVHEVAARRFAPKAQITAYKTRDECVLAVQSGRADCVIMAVVIGLTAIAKNPNLGQFVMLTGPRVQLPTCMGIRMEPDKRWRDFLDAWVDFNRGTGQIREWLYSGLALTGVKPEMIPPDLEF
ncbi:MAG TPA: transporter substrate-binding domain-containing protein [Candidatus Sulfotelmatobacter sp.]|nr:transporter substrate-binding domain-containing protein [Candidatus Sulfotelmatobacter sp.]